MDSARQSQIEGFRSERRNLSPSGKGKEEDQFGEVVASPNSHNLSGGSINQNCRIQVFYDGTCGLCHKFVLFILRNMKEKVFIFLPQSGNSFKSINGSEKYLGKTIIVYLVAEKKLLSKGAAIQLILLHLKQPWRLAFYFLRCIPTPILDYIYDFVARIRHSIFKKPNGACPIVSAKWLIYFKDDNS